MLWIAILVGAALSTATSIQLWRDKYPILSGTCAAIGVMFVIYMMALI